MDYTSWWNNRKPKVICLCGSTRFKEDFFKWNEILTRQNIIVVMPGVFAHSGDPITEEEKVRLDTLHKHKIAMSDGIFIIDRDKYIGESTTNEIFFAKILGLDIRYMSEVQE